MLGATSILLARRSGSEVPSRVKTTHSLIDPTAHMETLTMPELTKPEIARILDTANAVGVSIIESPEWFWDNWQVILSVDTVAQAIPLVTCLRSDLAMLVTPDSLIPSPTRWS